MTQTYLRMNWDSWAESYTQDLADIFKDRLYVELMDHGLEIESKVRDGLLRIARKLSLPLLATNDCHYTHACDAQSHDALLCLQTQSKLSDEKRMRFNHASPGLGYHLASLEEMQRVFGNHLDAVSNTQKLAESVSYDKEVHGQASNLVRLSDDPAEALRGMIWGGFPSRYDKDDAIARERVRYELEELIIPKGYAEYFIATADYVQWARRQGIVVGPARGSGAASACAYILRITELEPIELDLPVERFINPERPSMPDFDVDFEERRRHEVFDYLVEKYGDEHVAMIGTVGVFKPRVALRDAARVLGAPYDVADALSDAYPADKAGFHVPLGDVFDETHKRYSEGEDFRKLAAKHGDIVKLAMSFEGKVRQTGIHPCGVVLSKVPLTDIVPVAFNRSVERWYTECDVDACEQQGLIKHDILGLKELSVIAHCIDLVKQNTGKAIELPHRLKDLNDQETFALLSRGESLGVFQLDSSGMQSVLRNMKVTKFTDISVVVAAYRPGPMEVKSHVRYANRKNGRESIDYIHPELTEALRPILEETYGLIIYQEQVMRIAQVLAGYSLGEADILRRIMGKKKPAELDAAFPRFHDGMLQNGYSEAAIQTVWDTLIPFSEYGFNKSHSVGYGLIGYWGAYLKARYPAEYMSAQLSTHAGDSDKVKLYLAECQRLGIKLVLPNIQRPSELFRGEKDVIYMGMTSIKNVASNDVDMIVKHPDVITSVSDAAQLGLNKTTLHRLAECGAFDKLYVNRSQAIEFARLAVHARKKNTSTPRPEGEDVRVEQRDERIENMKLEMQYMQRYVSAHPCDLHERALRATGATLIPSIKHEGDYSIAGVVHSVEHKTSRAGKHWGIVTLDDSHGTMRCLVFPGVWSRYKDIEQGVMCVIHGAFETKDGESSLIVKKIEPLDLTAQPYSRYIVVTGRTQVERTVQRLKAVAEDHSGRIPVFVLLHDADRKDRLYKTSVCVSASSACETAMMQVGNKLYCNRD